MKFSIFAFENAWASFRNDCTPFCPVLCNVASICALRNLVQNARSQRLEILDLENGVVVLFKKQSRSHIEKYMRAAA